MRCEFSFRLSGLAKERAHFSCIRAAALCVRMFRTTQSTAGTDPDNMFVHPQTTSTAKKNWQKLAQNKSCDSHAEICIYKWQSNPQQLLLATHTHHNLSPTPIYSTQEHYKKIQRERPIPSPPTLCAHLPLSFFLSLSRSSLSLFYVYFFACYSLLPL